MNRQKFSMVKD